jgi:hypothetical protein
MTRRIIAGCVMPALCAVAVATLLVQSIEAATIPTSEGSGADSMLARDDSGNGGPFTGDEMLGGGSSMQIRAGDGTNRNRLGILRFDVSGLSSVNSTDANITFRETGNNGRPIIVYGLNDGDAGESWAEATITYNTAPAISFNNSAAPALSTDFDGGRVTNLGTFTTTGSTDEIITFATAALEAFIDDDTNGLLTFYFYQDNQNGNIVVTTKEGGRAPTLNLIPEPASALLLSVLGLSLAAFRRR